MYLKALSQLVEVENDFTIVDNKGEQQGSVHVEIVPEGDDGSDLDYLKSSEELLHQDIVLAIHVDGAKNLPARYANSVFVSYQFMDQSLDTQPVEGKSLSPQFNHQTKIRLAPVTEEIRQHLLTEAIIFEVKGYTDAQVRQLAELGIAPGPVRTQQRHGYGGGSSQPNSPGVGMSAPCGVSPCDQCEEQPASLECTDCARAFCTSCFELLHKSAKKQDHRYILLQSMPADAGQGQGGAIDPSALPCNQCEEQQAHVVCVECDKFLCGDCDALLHKSAKKQAHARSPVAAMTGAQGTGMAPAAGAAAACMQCEEAQAILQCADCERLFCEACNELLHKSAKKRDHRREYLQQAAGAVNGYDQSMGVAH